MKKFLKNLQKYKLFIIGVFPFLWLLYRTGMKPSRIQYPCQQLSLKHSTVFLQSLLALPISEHLAQYLSFDFSLKRFFKIVLIVFLILSLYLCVVAGWNWWQNYQSRVAFEIHKSKADSSSLSFNNNGELSSQITSSDVYDHRVVSIHSSEATSWDYSTGMHWEYINQDIVNEMVNRGVMALTGETSPKDAWRALIPYQPGEAVAIKVNFNNSWNCGGADDNEMDNYAETVNAVIDGLISIGIPPELIWITDPSRTIGNRFRDRITTAGVYYYSASGSYPICDDPDYFPTDYVAIDSSDTSPISNPPDEQVRPAQVLVDADHLINIPLMKGHGASWHTLALKNHYGSVLFKSHSLSEMHNYAAWWGSNYDPDRHPIGDINNNPHIKDKTRLILGDSLYGHPEHNQGVSPIKWITVNNDSPNMLFFGVDPIAVESVMLDWMNEESIQQGYSAKTHHDELHYSAEVLGLGIHEHWDSFENRQYTTIDYVEIDLDLETCLGNCLPLSCDQYLDCVGDVGICLDGYYCCTGTCQEPCEDEDEDFYNAYDPVQCPEGDDCDDFNPEIHPGAEEICDGLDNNCDGSVDENFIVPEIIPPLSPDSAIQGASLEVNLSGNNFQQDSTCDFQEGIQVLDCAFQNENLIIASIELDSDAELGSRDVIISTPDCSEVCSECFEVEFNCTRTDLYEDNRVDGMDLAFFGRAFGLSSDPSSPFYDPDTWWWPADLDGSGQVDGDDLALLASYFGDEVSSCE